MKMFNYQFNRIKRRSNSQISFMLKNNSKRQIQKELR
jgi:hypothetical protein